MQAVDNVFDQDKIAQEQQTFIVKVYGWMSLALTVTAIVAGFVSSSEELVSIIFSSKIIFIGLLLSEVFLVGFLVTAVAKMNSITATIVFIGYSVLNGVTLSCIFLLYTAESIGLTFFVTAGTFLTMSIFGYYTKKDLTSMGNLFLMGLVGLIIASIVNMFLKSEMLYWISTYIGILIFTGLIAYDTQKIKDMNIIGNEGTDEDKKEAIMGALTLYLDFINLFLKLLRVFGKRK